jgi:hypothetical protein
MDLYTVIAIFTPGDNQHQKVSDRFPGTTVVQTSQGFTSVSPKT